MRRFRRPGLFTNWLEVIVWAALSLGALLGSAAFVVRGPWQVGALLLAAHTFIVWRKFKDRVRDMRSVAYRTVHGVSVIFRGMAPIPQLVIEAMHEEAIAAHGHAEALDGYALVLQWAPLFAGATRVMGVTDAGYMSVDASIHGGVFVKGTIRHEAARAILKAQGLSVPQMDAIMKAHGTY